MRRPEERSRWLVPVAGIVIVCLTVWGLLMVTGGESSLVVRQIQATAIATRMIQDATAMASNAVNPLLARVGLAEERSDSAPAPSASVPPPTADRPAGAPVGRPRPAAPAGEASLTVNEGERGPFADLPPGENAPVVSVLGMEEGPTATLIEAGFNGRVFSELDEGVTTPRPLQPMLPALAPPGFPREALGIVEYVVDHRGRVESVKLVKESGRFQDRMALSIIKAWRFEPAYKDGQPVRYRQSVVLTQ
jgi:TonB family protein